MTKRDKLYLAGFLVLALLLIADLHQTNQLSEQMAQWNGQQQRTLQEEIGRVQQSVRGQLNQFREENGAFLTKETGAVYRDGALELTASFCPREMATGTTAEVEFWAEGERISVPALLDEEGTFTARTEFPLKQEIEARAVIIYPDGTRRREELPEIWPRIIDGLRYSSEWETREDGTYLKFCIYTDSPEMEGEDLADQIEAVEMALYTGSGKKLAAALQKDEPNFWQERGSGVLAAFEADVTALGEGNESIEQTTISVRFAGDLTFCAEDVASTTWKGGHMGFSSSGDGPLEVQWTN